MVCVELPDLTDAAPVQSTEQLLCSLHGNCIHFLQAWLERGTSRSSCASADRQATSPTTCT